MSIALTQSLLDATLDRARSLPVSLHAAAPPSSQNKVYAPVHDLVRTTFSFTLRELLHATGCKLASVPQREQDEAVRSAYLYLKILDHTRNDLGFARHIESDLLTNRSMELGIGLACLLVWKCWRIPWDQLAPIPGPGKRCDYRGVTASGLKAVFEAKGATRRSTQQRQIRHGLEKKAAHHARRQRFDIELVISLLIQKLSIGSAVVVADPPFDVPEDTFAPWSEKHFRLRHWAKLLAFAGATTLARDYRRIARNLVEPQLFPAHPKRSRRPQLALIYGSAGTYAGTWYDSWVSPKDASARSRLQSLIPREPSVEVFQGLRVELLEALVEGLDGGRYVAFESLTTDAEGAFRISQFEDGSAMAFRAGDR